MIEDYKVYSFRMTGLNNNVACPELKRFIYHSGQHTIRYTAWGPNKQTSWSFYVDRCSSLNLSSFPSFFVWMHLYLFRESEGRERVSHFNSFLPDSNLATQRLCLHATSLHERDWKLERETTERGGIMSSVRGLSFSVCLISRERLKAPAIFVSYVIRCMLCSLG